MRLELTKRGDYAVRAMLALTRGAGQGLLSARRIADAMDIPVRFLPQVLADLQRAGLIEAAPGRSGGYRLARDPESVSLLHVIEAVEGDSRRQACVLRGWGSLRRARSASVEPAKVRSSASWPAKKTKCTSQ